MYHISEKIHPENEAQTFRTLRASNDMFRSKLITDSQISSPHFEITRIERVRADSTKCNIVNRVRHECNHIIVVIL